MVCDCRILFICAPVFDCYVGYRHNVLGLGNLILCYHGDVLYRIVKLYGWIEQYGKCSYIISWF